MKGTDELLQRCFDRDLSDDELRLLFGRLSRSGSLRREFSSLMELRAQFAATRTPEVPASLDERIARLTSAASPEAAQRQIPLRLIFTRRFHLSAAAAAAAAVVMLLGGFLAGKGTSARIIEKEYYYITELPAYVVQGSSYDVRNN